MKKRIQSLFLENNSVPVFSKLNPFVNDHLIILKGLGEIASLGKIAHINLTKDLDKLKAGYHKRLRTYITKKENYVAYFWQKAQKILRSSLPCIMKNKTYECK